MRKGTVTLEQILQALRQAERGIAAQLALDAAMLRDAFEQQGAPLGESAHRHAAVSGTQVAFHVSERAHAGAWRFTAP